MHRGDRDAIRRIKGATNRVECQPYAFGGPPRQPRLGGSSPICWCQFASSMAAAAGTWPSITPGSVSGVTIYRPLGGHLVALAGTFRVWNWYPVAFAAGKTTAVAACGDGTFELVEQAC